MYFLGTAGSLSWFVNYPADILKTRFQADSSGKYTSLIHCLKNTHAENGWRTFTQGLGSTLLRGFPTNAVTFMVVEWVVRFGLRPPKMSKNEYDIWEKTHRSFLVRLPEAGATYLDPDIPHFGYRLY